MKSLDEGLAEDLRDALLRKQIPLRYMISTIFVARHGL